jgi:hypothetical protein
MSSMNHFMLRMNQFRLHYCPATTTKLRVLRPLHHGSLATRAPVVPLPRYRGGGWCERSRSRDALASEFCQPKPRMFCLQKNKGRRSAEKAQLSRGASPRSGCCHPYALRAWPRVQRNALAFRRSTAALASAMCRSSIQAALHAMQCAGVTRTLAPRLSEAPRAPVVMPAGSMPGPPESGSDEPPPAGTAPTPSVGVTG